MKEKIIIFLKGSAALLIANLCTKAINFFLLPLYTKYLSPEQLGVSDSITTMTSLFFPILVLGLDSAYSAFYFDEKTDVYKNKVFSTTSFTLVLTSVVPCIGIFCFNFIWYGRIWLDSNNCTFGNGLQSVVFAVLPLFEGGK